MTTAKNLWMIITTSCLCFPFASSAQLLSERFYFKADAGLNWLADTELKKFFGDATPDADVSFDIGPRVGFGAGYNVTDWFAPELEIGFVGSDVRKITGATRSDAYFGSVPFLVNARFQLPPSRSPLIPYVGAGVGGSAMFLDADNLELNGTRVWGTGGDVVFSYQAFAGVRCKITADLKLGVEYRYFGADAPEFDGDDDHFRFGDDSIRFGRIEGHAISITLEFRF